MALGFSTILGFSQSSNVGGSCVDTVRKSGYIFEVFSEQTLKKAEKRRRKLKRAGVVEIEIDNPRLFFFVESDSGITEAELANMFQDVLRSNGTDVFTFCPYQWNLYQEICGLNLGPTERECNFPNLASEHYYQIEGFRGKLFKIYFIRADWQLFTVPISKSRVHVSSSFPINRIDMHSEYFYLHYAIRVITLDQCLGLGKKIKIGE